MDLKKRNCPLCGKNNNVHIKGKRIQYVREFKTYGPMVVRCNNCGMIFLNRIMTDNEYRDFYNKDLQRKFAANLIKEDYKKKVGNQSRYRRDLLAGLLNKKHSLLDVGCGYCDFLLGIKHLVGEVIGLEPSSERAKYCKEHGVEIFNGTLEELDSNKTFDIITLFQVLEHVANLYPFIGELKKRLTNQGRIVIEVPNHDDLLVKIKKYKWFYYQNAHVNYFTLKTLRSLFHSSGLTIEREIPLQRYSLSNHLHWIITGSPGNVNSPKALDSIYKTLIKRTKWYDTIFLIVKRK